MKDAFDVLMITHSSLCKGYEGALMHLQSWMKMVTKKT